MYIVFISTLHYLQIIVDQLPNPANIKTHHSLLVKPNKFDKWYLQLFTIIEDFSPAHYFNCLHSSVPRSGESLWL